MLIKAEFIAIANAHLLASSTNVSILTISKLERLRSVSNSVLRSKPFPIERPSTKRRPDAALLRTVAITIISTDTNQESSASKVTSALMKISAAMTTIIMITIHTAALTRLLSLSTPLAVEILMMIATRSVLTPHSRLRNAAAATMEVKKNTNECKSAN